MRPCFWHMPKIREVALHPRLLFSRINRQSAARFDNRSNALPETDADVVRILLLALGLLGNRETTPRSPRFHSRRDR